MIGARATVARSQLYYLDITHRLANKGDGIAALAQAFGVELTQVAALGDMTNDLPMFARAGLSVAMGQAPACVRAAADATATTNEEAGVADAIAHFVRPRICASDEPTAACRAIASRRRLHAAGRRSSRSRCGGRGLDSSRHHGRPVRSGHLVRTRHGRGRAPSDGEAPQCPSDGGRAGTLARALCSGRRGSSAGPGGARVDHSSPSGAEPRARARLPPGRGDRPGDADPVDRPCPPSRRHHSGDDRQSRFRRPAVPARDSAQDRRASRALRGPRPQSAYRG